MHIEFLFDVFKEFEFSDSIIWKGKKLSYRSLIDNIEKYQLLIDKHKIKEGSVVALEGDFSPNSIALLLALIEKTCIIVPLTNTSKNNENKLFSIAQVEFVFRINENDVITTETVSNKTDNYYYKVMSNEFKHSRKSKMELWLDDHNHEMELIRTMVALFILALQIIILYKIYSG